MGKSAKDKGKVAGPLRSWLSSASKRSSASKAPASSRKSATPQPKRRPSASTAAQPIVLDLDSSPEPEPVAGPSRPRPPKRPAAIKRECSEIVDLDGDADEDGGAADEGSCGELMPARVIGGEIIDLDDDEPALCPVCSDSLDDLSENEASGHVNRCMDGLTASSKRAKSRAPSQPVAGPSRPKRAATSVEPGSAKRLRPISAFRHDRTPSVKPEDSDDDFAGEAVDFVERDEPELELCGAHDKKPNAFTALMVGHAEDRQWKKAQTNYWEQKGKRNVKREAPFYKVLDGMPIAVDAFCYGAIPGVKAYFLSHMHSDHYTALSGSWCHGPIYCSKTSANLMIAKLGVDPKWVNALDEDVEYTIQGVKVTVLDANHCPGSSVFVFEGRQTLPGSPYAKSPRIFRYFHTGDFRASPVHLENPALKDKTLDIIYLDTTYCNPRYQFPAQEQVIDACADLIRARVEGDKDAMRRGLGGDGSRERSESLMKGWLAGAKKEEPDADAAALALANAKPAKEERILVLIGTYSIGKERIVKAIAKAIGSKIFASEAKHKIFSCFEDDELKSRLTRDPLDAQVHVTNLFGITQETLSNYLDSFKGKGPDGKDAFTKIIGLRPTGWTFKPSGGSDDKNPSPAKIIASAQRRDYSPAMLYPQRDSTERCQAYGVPYSEHSSMFELTCFCVSTQWVRIIPTVNVHNETSRNKMKQWFEKWAAERKRRRDALEPMIVPPRNPAYW